MFRFTRKPSSGSHSQYLAKIRQLVQYGYIEIVQALSVLWMHNMTCKACVCCALCKRVLYYLSYLYVILQLFKMASHTSGTMHLIACLEILNRYCRY